jgi:hypothetical protein
MGTQALEKLEETYEGRVMWELPPRLQEGAVRIGHACAECARPSVAYYGQHMRLVDGRPHDFKYYFCEKHGLEYMAIHGIRAGKL